MKYISIIFFLTIFASVAFPQQTRESKARHLFLSITARDEKYMRDYQEIDIKVTKAENAAYNDTASLFDAEFVRKFAFDSVEYETVRDMAKQEMDKVGVPNENSSLLSDRRYYEYKKLYDDYDATYNMLIKSSIYFMDKIKSRSNNRERLTNNFWDARCKFRYTDEHGETRIGYVRYLIDESFSKVLYNEDLMDDSCSSNIIKAIVNGENSSSFLHQ